MHAVFIPEISVDLEKEAARLKTILETQDCVNIFICARRRPCARRGRLHAVEPHPSRTHTTASCLADRAPRAHCMMRCPREHHTLACTTAATVRPALPFHTPPES